MLDLPLSFHLSELRQSGQNISVAFSTDPPFLISSQSEFFCLLMQGGHCVVRSGRCQVATHVLNIVQIHDVQVIGVKPRQAALNSPPDRSGRVVEGVKSWTVPTALRNLVDIQNLFAGTYLYLHLPVCSYRVDILPLRPSSTLQGSPPMAHSTRLCRSSRSHTWRLTERFTKCAGTQASLYLNASLTVRSGMSLLRKSFGLYWV